MGRGEVTGSEAARGPSAARDPVVSDPLGGPDPFIIDQNRAPLDETGPIASRLFSPFFRLLELTLFGPDGTLAADTPQTAEIAALPFLRLPSAACPASPPGDGVAAIDHVRPSNGPEQARSSSTGVEPDERAPHSPAPADPHGESSGIAEKGGKARAFSEVPKTPAVWIATAAGLGFGPWAPGTWGAAGTALAFAFFLSGLGWLAYGAIVVAVTALGVWASGAAEQDFARHDDGRIVIDEVAGQLVTLWPLVPLRDLALGHLDLSFGLSPETTFLQVPVFGLLVVTGFVAFRWFDIRKPGLVRWAERRFEAGAGVMADDVVAGVYGALALIVPAYVAVVSRGLGGGA